MEIKPKPMLGQTASWGDNRSQQFSRESSRRDTQETFMPRPQDITPLPSFAGQDIVLANDQDPQLSSYRTGMFAKEIPDYIN
jgi:hypothetical protein